MTSARSRRRYAVALDGAETSDAVLQRADAALYTAKEAGRDRIAAATWSHPHMRSSA